MWVCRMSSGLRPYQGNPACCLETCLSSAEARRVIRTCRSHEQINSRIRNGTQRHHSLSDITACLTSQPCLACFPYRQKESTACQLSVYLSIYLPTYLSICLVIYPSVCLSILSSMYLSIYLSVYHLSVCLSSVYVSYLSTVCLSTYHLFIRSSEPIYHTSILSSFYPFISLFHLLIS